MKYLIILAVLMIGCAETQSPETEAKKAGHYLTYADCTGCGPGICPGDKPSNFIEAQTGAYGAMYLIREAAVNGLYPHITCVKVDSIYTEAGQIKFRWIPNGENFNIRTDNFRSTTYTNPIDGSINAVGPDGSFPAGSYVFVKAWKIMPKEDCGYWIEWIDVQQ